MCLINCEIELDLTWSKNCVIFEISRTPEVYRNNPVDVTLTTGVFKKNLYGHKLMRAAKLSELKNMLQVLQKESHKAV